jgi:tRNA acetyltransferase TAN1
MQYYEKSSGDQDTSQVTGKNADNDDEEDDDIEAQVRKEVEGLKPKSSKPRLFQKVTSNLPCSKLPFTRPRVESLLPLLFAKQY